MSQPSTKPVSGMRDFLPQEARRRRRAFSIIEATFQRYGFDPLDTPAMERLSTLMGKYGDEGDQLLFKVLKRGNKLQQAIDHNPTEWDLADAGLRYDLTVPLARVFAQYINDLPRIFKRYQIAPVWRADRPQKGRYREFVQCDVDVVGSPSMAAEVEVLSALSEILHQLDFPEFTILLNHREILFAATRAAHVPDNLVTDAIVTLDKFDKIGLEGVRQELQQRGLPTESSDRLIDVLALHEFDPDERIPHLFAIFADDPVAISALEDLQQLLTLLSATCAATHVTIHPMLARGLSYYTGPIFEIVSPNFAGSIGGGGRYDELIGMFRGETIPAVGASLGIERILMILEERDKATHTSTPAADALVTLWDPSFLSESLKLATDLRAAGIQTDLYLLPDKLGRQFSYADQRQIPYTLVIAPDEVANHTVQIKEMATGIQTEVKRDEVADWLVKHT